VIPGTPEYIPSVAAALACIACKCKNTQLRGVILEASAKWEQEDATIAAEDLQVTLRVVASSLGPDCFVGVVAASTDLYQDDQV
jgi:hypothetical protein